MSPAEYLREPYSRIVIPTDDGFHAEILEFPGCYAQGETAAEAYENLEASAASWIEACLETGQEIPEPFSNVGFSGKIALRLPRSLHRQASRMAERDGTSLNQFLVSAVACRVGAEDLYTAMARRFAQHAASDGPNDDESKPAAVVPIVSPGIRKVAPETNLSVDARKVTPRPKKGAAGR